MTRALQEPSGLPGSIEKDRWSGPPGFLSAYPGYRSTALLDRLRVTEYADWHVTPNATGACRLVGEAYPFGPRTRLILTYDNHNWVSGIREFARARGAVRQYVPRCSPELRVDDNAIRQALARHRPGPLGAARRVARCGVAPWAGRGLRARRQRSPPGASGLAGTSMQAD